MASDNPARAQCQEASPRDRNPRCQPRSETKWAFKFKLRKGRSGMIFHCQQRPASEQRGVVARACADEDFDSESKSTLSAWWRHSESPARKPYALASSPRRRPVASPAPAGEGTVIWHGPRARRRRGLGLGALGHPTTTPTPGGNVQPASDSAFKLKAPVLELLWPGAAKHIPS